MNIFCRTLLVSILALPQIVVGQSSTSNDHYSLPLNVGGYTADAIVLEARKIGDVTLREEDSLAVLFRVAVNGYLPRGLEPVLLLDGEPVGYTANVLSVEGEVTVLGFVVEQLDRLQDGAMLAIQMGGEEATRSQLKTPFQRKLLTPLTEEQAGKYQLPRTINH